MTVRDLHREAMDLAEQSLLARRRGDHEAAASLVVAALEKESAAADLVSEGEEPTRSVLFRSAGHLALEAGFTKDALDLAIRGLSGEPPSPIKSELAEVLHTALHRLGEVTELGGGD